MILRQMPDRAITIYLQEGMEGKKRVGVRKWGLKDFMPLRAREQVLQAFNRQ
jgi:hypothetical protein